MAEEEKKPTTQAEDDAKATETEQVTDAPTDAPTDQNDAEGTSPEKDADDAKSDKKKKKKKEKSALEKAQAELAEKSDQYLRLAAEYQNYRNRTTEEKKKIYADAKIDCVSELLSAMDCLERAIEATCSDENYQKGVELTLGQMQKAFETLGVTAIAPAVGDAFDPKMHNAIKQVDDGDGESDTIFEVYQKGYLLGDRLIRPAMVAVKL